MMRFVLLFLLFTGVAVAQENNPPATAPAPSKLSGSSHTKASQPVMSASPAVITIKGVCNSSSAAAKASGTRSATSKGPECKTVITRAEFEKLAETLQVPPAAKKQFATQYATALIMANEAHKKGLDRGQHYEDLLKLARLQVLTRQLAQNLQEESAKVSDQEIQNYYQNNKAAYEDATMERLYIPRTQQQEPAKDAAKESEDDVKKRQADSEAAMKKKADDLRARAAAGEDFTVLQAESYKFANFKAAPPAVKMDKARRTALPPPQAVVFDMKPGEVSQVLTDPGGYFVYKLEQKDTIPLDKVRDEIRSSLQKQKMQDAMQTMQQSATPSFDEAYFAATSPAPPTRAPGSAGDSPKLVPMPAPATHAPSAPPTGPQ